jgi:hypothetical protein
MLLVGGTAADAGIGAHAALCVLMPDACGLGRLSPPKSKTQGTLSNCVRSSVRSNQPPPSAWYR